MKVGVVTGFIPLPVKHLSAYQYLDLGLRLAAACEGATQWVVYQGRLEDCWAYDLCTGLPPANPPPEDRYPTPEINVMSHIVQHNRTTWAMKAARGCPEIDVWVWFDYGLLKQGFWKNNPITKDVVKSFLDRLAATKSLDVIPFPGIDDKEMVMPTGNNWRFCGSTHIWPTQFLAALDAEYKTALQKWIGAWNTVPLDLPIWALVEQNSGLPFRWYPAEYDASQLTGFNPGDYQ